jgi:hypothetical protein
MALGQRLLDPAGPNHGPRLPDVVRVRRRNVFDTTLSKRHNWTRNGRHIEGLWARHQGAVWAWLRGFPLG